MVTTPRDIRARLSMLGIVPKKSRGQNFLCDRGTIERVVRFADIDAEDSVIEVGPGLGAISDALITQAGHYGAVEIEAKFRDLLLELHPDLDPRRVIAADVRNVELPHEAFGAPPYVVVSNVPYSLSTDVTLWLIRFRSVIQRASLLLQREFAERLAAEPGGKEYGSLTVLTALYSDTRLGPIISGTVFLPPAEVESRLIEIAFLDEPRVPVPSGNLFENTVRASFSTRRKTILNALAGGLATFTKGSALSKAECADALGEAQIDAGRRAETLSVEEFGTLSWAVARRLAPS